MLPGDVLVPMFVAKVVSIAPVTILTLHNDIEDTPSITVKYPLAYTKLD
jgi:hypothetical protein